MSAMRGSVLGSVAALLLVLAACAGAPPSPPPDRTPLATSLPEGELPPTLPPPTGIAQPTDMPEGGLVAALGPLGLAGLASQFSTPQPLLGPRPTPPATPAAAVAAPAAAEPAAAFAAPDESTATPEPDLPAPATTPSPLLPPSPVPAALPPLAISDANIRDGPGLDFSVVGSVRAGVPLNIVACNANRTWFRLADGNWIFADLVANAPRALQVVASITP